MGLSILEVAQFRLRLKRPLRLVHVRAANDIDPLIARITRIAGKRLMGLLRFYGVVNDAPPIRAMVPTVNSLPAAGGGCQEAQRPMDAARLLRGAGRTRKVPISRCPVAGKPGRGHHARVMHSRGHSEAAAAAVLTGRRRPRHPHRHFANEHVFPFVLRHEIFP